MKLKWMICVVLAALLAVSCLTGCQNGNTADPGATTNVNTNQPAPAVLLSAVTNAKALGFSVFDNQLVEYLKQTGRADENFTVSPLSFKAALTMAALGAEKETQSQLLKALGFQNVDELRQWYATVLQGQDEFDQFFAGDAGTSAYRVVNSVWSNQDLPGAFRQSFLDNLAKTCRAEANSAGADALTNAVNAWVNEKTNGLIPSLLRDASHASAILVNALYLKTSWISKFSKCGDRDFTTFSGETVQKPFMNQISDLDYYEDEKTQLVSVPLYGGVSMVFVLGDDTGLAEKLSKAEPRQVDVTVPMFDLETTLDNKELVDYLRLMGCDRMFTDKAEFDPMYTAPLYVDDIIQKAKVHIDENGMEAAAATAIIEVMGAIQQPETPVIFCADRPFSFYVLQGYQTSELLFWGQIVR